MSSLQLRPDGKTCLRRGCTKRAIVDMTYRVCPEHLEELTSKRTKYHMDSALYKVRDMITCLEAALKSIKVDNALAEYKAGNSVLLLEGDK